MLWFRRSIASIERFKIQNNSSFALKLNTTRKRHCPPYFMVENFQMLTKFYSFFNSIKVENSFLLCLPNQNLGHYISV